MDPFRTRIAQELALFERYEGDFRLELLELAKELIETRIQNDMELRLVRSKYVDYLIQILTRKRKLSTRGSFWEDEEGMRNQLNERLQMVWGTIKVMKSNELLSLISKLRSDRPLVDILGVLKASKELQTPIVPPRYRLVPDWALKNQATRIAHFAETKDNSASQKNRPIEWREKNP